MRIAVISLAFIALTLLGVAALMEPYRNHDAVAQAMTAYPNAIENSRAASEKYWAIRDSQLTLKFTLQDYGLTALTAFFALWALQGIYRVRRMRNLAMIRIPVRRRTVLVLGLAAAFLTTSAFVVSLFLDASRDAFPPWADSLGIPLAGAPFILLSLIAIAVSTWIIGTAAYLPAGSLRQAFVPNTSPRSVWLVVLGAPLLLCAVGVAITALAGDFLFLAPSFLWLAFFAFVFAARQRPVNSSCSGRDIGGIAADARR